MHFIISASYEEIVSEDLSLIFFLGLTFQIVDKSSPAFANLLKHFPKQQNALVLVHLGMKGTEVSVHGSSCPAPIVFASNYSQIGRLILTEVQSFCREELMPDCLLKVSV